ncbi:MAG: hypothetical protein KIS61_33345 [Candidatus Eremiobacteraeota bacterium]|nr:hypothetical protein [Candidatus Eremiobacteraeota bacterium]
MVGAGEHDAVPARHAHHQFAGQAGGQPALIPDVVQQEQAGFQAVAHFEGGEDGAVGFQAEFEAADFLAAHGGKAGVQIIQAALPEQRRVQSEFLHLGGGQGRFFVHCKGNAQIAHQGLAENISLDKRILLLNPRQYLLHVEHAARFLSPGEISRPWPRLINL